MIRSCIYFLQFLFTKCVPQDHYPLIKVHYLHVQISQLLPNLLKTIHPTIDFVVAGNRFEVDLDIGENEILTGENGLRAIYFKIEEN